MSVSRDISTAIELRTAEIIAGGGWSEDEARRDAVAWMEEKMTAPVMRVERVRDGRQWPTLMDVVKEATGATSLRALKSEWESLKRAIEQRKAYRGAAYRAIDA